MELGDPEEVSWEMFDFAGLVVLGQFLLVVIEAGGQTMFGEIVHLVGANLELYNAFVFGDDCSMERLVAVLFWHGDIIFDAAGHRGIEGVDDA